MDNGVTQDLISGWGGWLAVIGLVINNAWSSYKSQKIDKAAGSAHLDLVNRMSDQLKDEREATKTANERADRFAQERNDLHQIVGEMKGEMRAMRQEIAALTHEVAELKGNHEQIVPA